MSPNSKDDKFKAADEHYQKGLSLFHKQLFQEAILEFDKAIEANQLYRPAYNERGMAYGYLGNHEKAVSDLTMAINLAPENPGAYTIRGVEFTRLKRYPEAIDDFTKTLDLLPTSFDVLILRAMAYFDSGDYARAIRDYGWAIELNSQDASLYYRRATVHSIRSMYELANNDYSFAIRLNPNYAEAYLDRGWIFCRQGLYEKGYEDFRKFLSLTSNSPRYEIVRKNMSNLLDSPQGEAKGWCVDGLQVILNGVTVASCKLDIEVPGLKSFSIDYPSEVTSIVISGCQLLVYGKNNKVFLDYFTPEAVNITVRWEDNFVAESLRPTYQMITPNGQGKLPICRVGSVMIDLKK